MWKAQLSNYFSHIRLNVSQQKDGKGANDFIRKNYTELKKLNPGLPIIIRENTDGNTQMVVKTKSPIYIRRDANPILNKVQDIPRPLNPEEKRKFTKEFDEWAKNNTTYTGEDAEIFRQEFQKGMINSEFVKAELQREKAKLPPDYKKLYEECFDKAKLEPAKMVSAEEIFKGAREFAKLLKKQYPDTGDTTEPKKVEEIKEEQFPPLDETMKDKIRARIKEQLQFAGAHLENEFIVQIADSPVEEIEATMKKLVEAVKTYGPFPREEIYEQWDVIDEQDRKGKPIFQKVNY